MKALLTRIFLANYPRKIVALFAAVVIWFLVYQSMTATRTIPDVPVKITHLHPDKTVEGLLANGQLKKRIPVTITGKKTVVEEIRPGDIEILINAEERQESWIAPIDKKNLISLIPSLDFQKDLIDVSAPDIDIKLTDLVTEEIPVTIRTPIGESPKGYQFLDIWPKTLMQTVSGPKEQVEALKKQGLEITFSLNNIRQEELDDLQQAQRSQESDEVSFFVPSSWKEISIPFRDEQLEPLNDPRAKFLRIDFLRSELLLLPVEIPIQIYFPLKYSNSLNPDTLTLANYELITKKNGIPILAMPLLVKDVSRFFLDIVKDNLELVIIAEPKEIKERLNWTVEVIDQEILENEFVARSLHEKREGQEELMQPKLREEYLRHRFRTYVLQMRLYTIEERKLRLFARIENKVIRISLSSN